MKLKFFTKKIEAINFFKEKNINKKYKFLTKSSNGTIELFEYMPIIQYDKLYHKASDTWSDSNKSYWLRRETKGSSIDLRDIFQEEISFPCKKNESCCISRTKIIFKG
jgi:hypothetical protein